MIRVLTAYLCLDPRFEILDTDGDGFLGPGICWPSCSSAKTLVATTAQLWGTPPEGTIFFDAAWGGQEELWPFVQQAGFDGNHAEWKEETLPLLMNGT